MNKFLFSSTILAAFFMLSSCVPQKKFEELSGQHAKCQEENTRLKTENLDITSKSNELLAKLSAANKAVADLGNDTSSIGMSLRKYTKLHGDLNKVYEKLIELNVRHEEAAIVGYLIGTKNLIELNGYRLIDHDARTDQTASRVSDRCMACAAPAES